MLEELKTLGVDFGTVERQILLRTVDRNWIDHIDAMDQLRKGIGLRAFGQVDPIIAYKKEGFEMFDEMVERIQRTTISVLLKVKLEIRQAPAPAPTQPQKPAAPAQPAPVKMPTRRIMPSPLSSMSSHQPPKNDQNK